MTKRFLLIANPIAGGGRGQTAATRLRDALTDRGCAVELFLTQRAGDAAARASRVATAGEFDGVISVGGDGTLHEVLGGLRDPSTPLGICAMGTANVMARELQLPREPGALADVFLAGHTKSAAIGLVNGERFLLFVSSGLDARIVDRVTTVRKGKQGMWRYIAPTLYVIRRWEVQPIRVTTIEGETLDGLSTVIATRVASYAGIMRFPGQFDLGDGQLHILAFRQRSRWAYFWATLRALTGRLRLGRDVIAIATKGLRMEMESDVPWQVDGELGGRGAVEITLDSTEARLFAPEGV